VHLASGGKESTGSIPVAGSSFLAGFLPEVSGFPTLPGGGATGAYLCL
jgi:hypothetical protein